MRRTLWKTYQGGGGGGLTFIPIRRRNYRRTCQGICHITKELICNYIKVLKMCKALMQGSMDRGTGSVVWIPVYIYAYW